MAVPTEAQNQLFFQLYQSPAQKYETSIENMGNVILSNTLCDGELELDKTQTEVKGGEGYRTVLATHGATEGTYYYELEFIKTQEDSHLRAGFATQNCHLDGPVGFDRHCFALRSFDCSVCTARKRYSSPCEDLDIHRFSERSIKSGDILSFLLHIPVIDPPFELPDETEMCITRSSVTEGRKQIEQDEEEISDLGIVRSTVVELPEVRVPGSFIRFYVNGELIAQVRNLCYQRYYPAISLFNFGVAKVNFGRINTRIPGYPEEFYCLACALAQLTGDYAIYGAGGCKQDFIESGDRTAQTRSFEQFIKSELEPKSISVHIDVQEVANLGFKFYSLERMGEIMEYRDLYIQRSSRECAIIIGKLEDGEFSIDLFKEMERFYRESKRPLKKLKK